MDLGGPSRDLLLDLLSASSLRARVISGNLANENTPGYRRRVVRFEELLASELESLRSGVESLRSGQPRPDDVERLLLVKPRVDTDETSPASPDGNNVNLELEMNAMRENKLLYELYASILTTRNRMIEDSIQSGR